MEYHAAVPAVADLSGATAQLVVELFQPVTPVVRRDGNVFSRAAMVGELICRRVRGHRFCLQRIHAEPAHVAESHGHVQLDAVGGAGRGSRLAPGREKNTGGRPGWRHANARRGAGNDISYLAHCITPLGAATFLYGNTPWTNALALSVGGAARVRAERRAIVAVSRSGGPCPARDRLHGFALVDARNRSGQFPGAHGVWNDSDGGNFLPEWTVLDV